DRPSSRSCTTVNLKVGASNIVRIRSCEVGRQACDFLDVWNFESLLCCQSRSPADSALELGPGQQISEPGLQQFCFGLVVCCGGLSYIRDQDDTLSCLIGRQAFALRA